MDLPSAPTSSVRALQQQRGPYLQLLWLGALRCQPHLGHSALCLGPFKGRSQRHRQPSQAVVERPPHPNCVDLHGEVHRDVGGHRGAQRAAPAVRHYQATSRASRWRGVHPRGPAVEAIEPQGSEGSGTYSIGGRPASEWPREQEHHQSGGVVQRHPTLKATDRLVRLLVEAGNVPDEATCNQAPPILDTCLPPPALSGTPSS